MKVDEVEERKEKGRHERNSIEAVMLLKKFKHDEVVKFWVKIPSKAWGKGVGSTGGEEGTEGKIWVDDDDDDAGPEDVDVDVGGADNDDDDDDEEEDTIEWEFGPLFHLDWWEFFNPYHEGEEEKTLVADFRRKLVGNPPPQYTVNAIRMKGTRITAHRNRLPARRFVSCCEFQEDVSSLVFSVEGSPHNTGAGTEISKPLVPDGWGEGGGVNMTDWQ